MFTETAYKNAEACRFCWMCRHLCPICNKTGNEVNSAHAKGLLVSMTKRGHEYEPSMAKAMWECCLCGACTNDCATGYEPRSYIREARSEAIAKDIAPADVMAVVDKMLETGNMYGAANLQEKLDLAGIPTCGKVLLYIGEVASYEVPEIAKAAMSLLKKAGVEFAVLKDEPTSGAYMGDMIGFVDEVRQQALKASKAIEASGAETVIVLDPIDARIMKHEYAEWNCAPKAVILTATSFFANLVTSGALKLNKLEGVVSIHDAGALSRDLDETAPIRELVTALGLDIHEMYRHNDLAMSCGGALLKQYDPAMAALTCEGRWYDVERIDSNCIVTEAPGSYAVLSSKVPEGYEISDYLFLLDKASK